MTPQLGENLDLDKAVICFIYVYGKTFEIDHENPLA
jgi:hypothetical protein